MKKLLTIAGLAFIAATHATVASASICSVGSTGILNVDKPRKASSTEVGYFDSVMGKQKMLYTPGSSVFCKAGSRVPLRALRGSTNCQLEPRTAAGGGNEVGKLVCP